MKDRLLPQRDLQPRMDRWIFGGILLLFPAFGLSGVGFARTPNVAGEHRETLVGQIAVVIGPRGQLGKSNMFQRVLIANRGEIAVRIAHTLQRLGMTAIAVYSEADRCAVHVGCADEAYPLEGMTAGESYLDVEQIIDTARRHHAEAIHPGYGFLSENAKFAAAVEKAGMKFIGPAAKVIEELGDKVRAKAIMVGANVPVLPGWSGPADVDFKTVIRQAEEIGWPVLIKAAAGGGGKGMRVVHHAGALQDAWAAAQREAQSAFADARVFLEKYLERPRHVEFQIFGDHRGNVVHLFERECSVQRRHQKIIEESPSPALTVDLRARMADAAVRAARASGYTNAGTVEFLLDSSGDFYFLEVNARLQVEHPVTEMISGYDLVELQLRVALDERLPFEQEHVQPRGHAVECRVYAEDPARGFVPSTGDLTAYEPPMGPDIRVDSGVRLGTSVTPYYDPMLAKVITWGRTRDAALDRMEWALGRFVILGVTTNVSFLSDIVRHPQFRAGHLHTSFLDEHTIDGRFGDVVVPDEAIFAAVIGDRAISSQVSSAGPGLNAGSAHLDPWQSIDSWRIG